MSQIPQAVKESTGDGDPCSTVSLATSLPDQTQLPDKDGNFVKNYQQPPQG